MLRYHSFWCWRIERKCQKIPVQKKRENDQTRTFSDVLDLSQPFVSLHSLSGFSQLNKTPRLPPSLIHKVLPSSTLNNLETKETEREPGCLHKHLQGKGTQFSSNIQQSWRKQCNGGTTALKFLDCTALLVLCDFFLNCQFPFYRNLLVSKLGWGTFAADLLAGNCFCK